MVKSNAFIRVEDMPQSPDFEVAFIGKSNVGKSSLINSLLNRKHLAPTSTTPGKTRRINLYKGPQDGWIFADLPGYGYAKVSDTITKSWALHLEKYLVTRPHLLIFLFDMRRDPKDQDLEFLTWVLKNKIPFILVLTKADKIKKGKRSVRKQEILRGFEGITDTCILHSTLKSIGKNELWSKMRERKQIWDS